MAIINIVKMNMTVSTSKLLTSRVPKYINIHYTGAVGSNKGTAINTCKYWNNNPKIQASADFVCDDALITQYTPDIVKYYTWAVGGKANKTKTTSVSGILNGKDTNKNSISIEICCRKVSTKTKNASDNDWYFTEESLNNAVLLTRYLMALYNIPLSNVVTHHHVTGKLCPSMWCINESRLSQYHEFLTRVASCVVPTATYTNYSTNVITTNTANNTVKNTTPTTSNTNNSINVSKLTYGGTDMTPIYDAEYYYNHNADLQKALGKNPTLLFQHFCLKGMSEARQGNSTFSPVKYKEYNSDLAEKFGDEWKKYFQHYLVIGKNEGRRSI